MTRPESRYHVLMLAFEGTDTAARSVERVMKEECAVDGCEIEGASIVCRDAAGQIHVHEKGVAGWGAAIGATAMGVVGVVTGPVALPILLIIGALAGGIAGHFAGQIVPADDLKRAGASLRPNSSAFIAIVDTAHAQRVIEAFGEEVEVLIDSPMESDVSNAIREAVFHEVRRG